VPPDAPNFSAQVDVTAQAGSFTWGVPQLALQGLNVPIHTTPAGLHAEARIFVDTTVPLAQQKVAVYFDATTQNGLAIDFKLSLTPIDSHSQPTGPAKSYELTWTTSPSKPAFLQGPVYLQDLKPAAADPSPKDAAAPKGGA
jgi:hypothetical protein